MKNRIRSAVILIQDQKILLVKHVDPSTGVEWWVPPGGGLEDQDDSILSCAVRETHEETGLVVSAGRLVYLREFVERSTQTRHVELYFLGSDYSGELTLANVAGSGPDEDYIQQIAWLSKEEIQGLTVYPQELQGEFWEDFALGFPAVRYLGTQSD